MTKIKLINLELEEDIFFPKKILIQGFKYFIIKDNENYFLASDTCPHMGGTIEFDKNEDCFLCPIHNWKFNKTSGVCSSSSQDMSLIEVNLTNGILWVDSSKIKIQKSNTTNKTLTTQQIKQPIKIKLISHATLNISLKHVEILVDPWIEGAAMLGAWRQYPLTGIKVKNLRPYAIVITHEHSDHFHIPTLAKFNKHIPIIIPNFPNKRIQRFLKELGFVNITILNFEEEINIHKKIKITFFKPVSVFNDSIALFDFDGYKILNLNDAGLNPNIAEKVKPVDLITCIFSTGASGYPFTWQHISEEEKMKIMERSCKGKIKLLMEALKLYDANYIIPFASHFRLWQPEHRYYLESIITNSIDDILNGFINNNMQNQLIDMIPGDSWNTENNEITRMWEDRKLLYDNKNIFNKIKLDFNENREELKINEYWQTFERVVTEKDVKNYFIYLNDSPDIRNCENINVNFQCWFEGFSKLKFEFNFEIFNGVLNINNKNHKIKAETNYRLEITENILEPIINGNLSWDEARVGYWIKWWRNTEEVKTGFLRLLQGPYNQKKNEKSSIYSGNINSSMSISNIIEIYGEKAEEIFENYGMYCSGCNLSPWEDVISGAKKHGISKENIDLLLDEIKQLKIITVDTTFELENK